MTCLISAEQATAAVAGSPWRQTPQWAVVGWGSLWGLDVLANAASKQIENVLATGFVDGKRPSNRGQETSRKCGVLTTPPHALMRHKRGVRIAASTKAPGARA